MYEDSQAGPRRERSPSKSERNVSSRIAALRSTCKIGIETLTQQTAPAKALRATPLI
jgi:hypothetical protein